MSEQKAVQIARPHPVRVLEQFLQARAAKLHQWAAGRLDPASLIRFALLDFARSKALQECTPESIYLALIACAQTGLEPGALRQHAFIIPYKGIATFMIGWRGFVHLARRANIRLTAELVHHGDLFKAEKGTSPRLLHEVSLEPGPLRGAYALARFSEDDFDFEWMRLDELEKVRDFAVRSRGGKLGAYEEWESEMMRKAPIRRISKRLPLGEDYLLAREIDLAVESGDLKTYKNLLDTEGELPELAEREEVPETRGVAGAKAQLRSRAKATPASESVPPDSSPASPHAEDTSRPSPEESAPAGTIELADHVRGLYKALETVLQNPEQLPMLRAQVGRLPECPDRAILLKQIERAERLAKEDAEKDPRGA